jgi:hypothetical protein
MSGRDPVELLAKAAAKTGKKNGKTTRHSKEATVLADLFGKLSAQLTAGEVSAARVASHRAHALLEVLAAMDAQDEHPELDSPTCEERKQAKEAWHRLMRPSAHTSADLHQHFQGRSFSRVRTAPLPPLLLPKPEPKRVYKGSIYETVFLPDDAKLAKELGLPDSYTFRHGTPANFSWSLGSAIERKYPQSKQRDIGIVVTLGSGAFDDGAAAFPTLRVLNYRVDWRDPSSIREVRYSIHSTTHEDAARALEAARKGGTTSKRGDR